MAGSVWTEANVPSQAGRVFVVTGGNGGIGFHTARLLAARGARVVIACRRPAAGFQAAQRIATADGMPVEVVPLDLASLSSIEACAAHLTTCLPRVDCLINNAGIMSIPRGSTADGFERQFGVNYLGHFALTARLAPMLLAAERPRVVTVTSAVLRLGRIDPADVGGGRYRKWAAYARSKLAGLLFALELDRRARVAGLPLISVAAHPGYAATGLQAAPERGLGPAGRRFWGWANTHLGAAPAVAALPIVRAATDPDAQGGDFYGPARLLRGGATRVTLPQRYRRHRAAGALWQASSELTGAGFPF